MIPSRSKPHRPRPGPPLAASSPPSEGNPAFAAGMAAGERWARSALASFANLQEAAQSDEWLRGFASAAAQAWAAVNTTTVSSR